MILKDIKGTTLQSFQIQKNGARLKNVSGVIQARNAADGTFADLYGAILKAASDLIEINSDAAGAGADWKYTISRPAAGMISNLTFTLPPNTGSTGQVLTTDGAGTLSWATPIAPSNVMKVESYSMPYNMFLGGTLNWFILPANGCVDKAKFIVDTDFLGMPFGSGCNAAIGNLGTLDKYAPWTFMNTIPAGEDFDSTINNTPLGVSEQITLSAGGLSFETQGTMRYIVEYY